MLRSDCPVYTADSVKTWAYVYSLLLCNGFLLFGLLYI